MAVLIAILVVADVAVVAWVVHRVWVAAPVHRQAYSEWLARLEADPVRRRLYEAHWRARWRAGLASLLDVLAAAAAGWTVWLGLKDRLGLHRRDGLSDPEFFVFLALSAAFYLAFVFGGFRLSGTTPGLRLLGIAVVSAQTGRPAERTRMRPPTRWDYRRGRVPDLLFVPADLLRESG
ncbi:MAG: hypothetical protein QN193_07855 [Armatimonadota bacterium]|nr:hypothetical protein [Armatimonadota bacterium]